MAAGLSGETTIFVSDKGKDMNTYKELCNFYRHCIEDEGMLDMQCYTGTYRVLEDTTLHDIAEYYFAGRQLEGTELHFNRADIVFYVYEDEGGWYPDNASRFLKKEDYFLVEDVDGQKVHCWLIGE